MRFLFIFMFIFCWALTGVAAPSIKSGFMENAPKIKSSEELESLVKYLIRPYKTDEDKAYVLLNWIVNFVDYDAYRYEKIKENNSSRRDLSDRIPEQGDILKTRLGVCADISHLYVQMLNLADIQAKEISGCITRNKWKQGDSCNRPHAWTAVWIDKQWELVDPTWAMGEANAMTEASSERSYKRAIRQRERRNSDAYESRDRRIVNRWFMASSKEMSEEHQPANEKWLLKKLKDRKNKNLE